MADPWPEVTAARSEKKRELLLSGPEMAGRIEASGLPESLFKLRFLNFLEISKANLSVLSDKIVGLNELTTLTLHSNKLSELPQNIGQLTKLKILSLADNQLTKLPEGLGSLKNLQSLNISHNKIEEIPSLCTLISLINCDASYNELKDFPVTLCNANLEHLAELCLRNNHIEYIPSSVTVLGALRKLDMRENKIMDVPQDVGSCQKLKDLLLHGNPLKDRRLLKLVEDSERHHKAMMDYIKKNGTKPEGQAVAGVEDQVAGLNLNAATAGDADQIKNSLVIKSSDSFRIVAKQAVLSVRAHVACCIVHNLDLSGDKLKQFISLQTKLHDTVCKKRQAATIATHDLKLVKGPLIYTVQNPDKLKIRPLNQAAEVSARELVRQLMQDAEQRRKECKRNKFSGIHQYLYLVKPWNNYPCFVDAEGIVISLPPITNSDITKISSETKHVMLEVTSSESLKICKEAMEALIKGMLELGLGTQEEGVVSTTKRLLLEQARVYAEDGNLRVAYPSKLDLCFDDLDVQREG